MTARLAGSFQTRAQLGLRKPNSISRNITPGNGGSAPHWGGPGQKVAGKPHSYCISLWLGYQRYHMDTHGWSDIAYTAGYCNHGYVLAGRGWGTRTAANGSNTGNQNFYAFCWIGGEGDPRTQEAYDALDWLILEARRNGGAGQAVRPHRYFTGSACPGSAIIAQAAERHLKPVPTSGGTYTPDVIEPTPKEPDMSQYGPENWDRADREAFAALIDGRLNNAVVKNTESTEAPNGRNFAWFQRRIEALGTVTLQNVNALAKVVEAHAKGSPAERRALAQAVADELGESLETIGAAAGKAAAEVTASDVVRRHAEALMAGINDEN